MHMKSRSMVKRAPALARGKRRVWGGRLRERAGRVDGLFNVQAMALNAKESPRHFIRQDLGGAPANELQIRSLL